jgi:hypothetical protein
MSRQKGAKNRTPRELRAEAQRLLEKAEYMERIAKLKKAAERGSEVKARVR